MKKIIFLAIAMLPLLGYAQIFKGKINDIYKNPINDAYIINVNKQQHAHSNFNGEFTIDNTSVGDTLKISHICYFSSNIIVAQQNLDQTNEIKLKERIIDLTEITIVNNIKAINAISTIDLQTNPVNSSQEVLRTVPGLIIGQHAGGGKAEQIFMRGFDMDHGTDINISADGIPVNMVSHAHGQGYADLHFIIPETIDNIDMGKGPYYANKGNLATVGYVDFKIKEKLDHNMISVEYGAFNTVRNVGLIKLLNNSSGNAYMAYEFMMGDGPFDSPQNFNRFNIMGKYVAKLPNNGKLTVFVSKFSSKWDASGQIPQRSVDAGDISRFGSIDDTEGGNTTRTNFSISLTKFLDKNTWFVNQAWYSEYDFDLFSNFTFFLNDPVNGDQIRQKESRKLYGNSTEIKHISKFGKTEITSHAGIGFRHDDVNDIELSHTKNRFELLERIQFGDISESNIFGFYSADIHIGKWMINPSARIDYFNFQYQDHLSPSFQTASANKWIVSPKLNFIYNANQQLQLFLKTGKGFHTNDTRVILSQDIKQAVPAVYGTDLGLLWKPFDRLFINISSWYLYMEQEFVYVGDEGVVEPGGKTQRFGLDYGVRYQILDWLYLVGDINYAFARNMDNAEGENYIPLAPDLSSAGGLYFKHQSGFSGGVRYRYIKNRPANEDNSIIAKGYFITDLNLIYTHTHWSFEIDIQNLFNTEWNETQFATETKLFDEVNSVEEIHFTPGTPFFMKGKITYRF